MSDHHDKKEQQREEALRAIDRVGAESETIGTSNFVSMAKRAQNHLGATDADEADLIEVWGTRLGRIAGLMFVIGLLVYLAITYL